MCKVVLKYLEDSLYKKGWIKKSEDRKGENEENEKRGENKDFCAFIMFNNFKEYLECMVFEIDFIDKENKIGIVNGLVWILVGGDVFKIEAFKIRGKGELKFIGSLGDVMKEFVIIVFFVVKVLLDNEILKVFIIFSEIFKDVEGKKKKKVLKVYNVYDLYLYVFEGVIFKDGLSVGIVMVSVIVSILCDRVIRSEVVMMGELILSGEVLFIGGLKEKLIAVFKVGIKIVFIFVKNYERDLDEIFIEVWENLNIVVVKNIVEVLEKILF